MPPKADHPAPPFAQAAAALMAEAPHAAGAPEVVALIAGLGLEAADAPLLRIAAEVDQVFRLPAPDAPGLAVFGAAIDLARVAGEAPGAIPMASASGVGETPAAAFRACMGEAAELIASAASRGRRTRRAPPDGVRDPALVALLDGLPWPPGQRRTLWHAARRLPDGARAWLPQEILFRLPAARRSFPPPWPLSLGCAAGRTPDEAALRALMELIERDAVALWWRGGMPARAIALEDPAQGRAAALLARLRADRAAARRSWILDITTDLGVPVAAAVSFAPDGGGFCCGTAARAGGLAASAEAAVLELAQMELGQALAARKAILRGPDTLNEADAAHLRRRDGVHAARSALVHPALPAWAGAPPMAEDTPAPAALDALLNRLAEHGLAPLRFDHAAGEGDQGAVCIPVIRMLCPGLESETTTAPGSRLREAVARTGGGAHYRDGIGLA